MVEDGKSPANIAQRFGLTEKQVNQRLRLGRLSPQLLDVLRAKKISIDVAQAFTVTGDHAAQDAVYASLVAQPWSMTPDRVRNMLTEQDVAATSDLGRFVRAEYLGGGHPVKTDLFAICDESGTYFTDRAVVTTIAQGKLDFEAARLVEQEGWRWSSALMFWDPAAIRGCDRIQPSHERGLTSEEAAEQAALEVERLSLLQRYGMDEEGGDEGHNGDEGDDEIPEGDDGDDLADAEAVPLQMTDADEQRLQELEDRLDELDSLARQPEYTAEQRAQAGALVYLRGGEMVVVRGYVRPEDVAQESQESANAQTQDGDRVASSPTGDQQDAGNVVTLPVVETRGIYSQSLIDDLCAVRTQAFQVTLAQHPDHALSLMLWRLWCSMMRLGYVESPTNISATRVCPQSSQSDLADSPAAKALESIRLRFVGLLQSQDGDGYRTGRNDSTLYPIIHALPMEQKLELLAYLTAITVQVPLAAHGRRRDEVVEQMGADMGVDVARWWRPTGAEFFGRVSKGTLTAVMDCLPEGAKRQIGGAKKATATELLDRWFAAPSDIPASDFGLGTSGVVDAETAAAVTAWVPPGMTFGVADAPEVVSVASAADLTAQGDDGSADHGMQEAA